MAKSQRTYDHEFRVQAVKLAKEIGAAKAARELGIKGRRYLPKQAIDQRLCYSQGRTG